VKLRKTWYIFVANICVCFHDSFRTFLSFESDINIVKRKRELEII
jgi:hypothetical protein